MRLRFSLLCLVLTATCFSQEKAGPIFKDGQAQIVPAFSDQKDWIRHELWVETEFNTDGDDKMDRVHVAVVRPKQTDTEGLKVPVIYGTSPYFAGTGSTKPEHMWNPRHELGIKPKIYDTPPPAPHRPRPGIANRVTNWVRYGFAAVHSSSPGTGLSQGCPTVGGPNESLAPKAVIDWLCGRAKGFTTVDGDEEVKATWCSGKVGMMGTSYEGTLPLAAATTGVEGLECIIPVAPNTSYYHYYRSNGLVRHPGGYMGEDIDVLYNFIHSQKDDEKRKYCDCEIRDKLYAENRDRKTGDYNDFWAGRDYLNQLDKMKCAILMGHAFNDWNVVPEHSVRIVEALKKRGDIEYMWYFHQFGHGGNPPFKLMNRWFSHYLYGVDNGIEKDPKSYIVREGKSRNSEPTAYPDYPHPEAKHVVLRLGKGGLSHGSLGLSVDDGQGTETLVDDVGTDKEPITGTKLAQADASKHRLLYVTPKLTETVHISGTARLKLKMASSKAAVNLSVWMVSLPWDKQQRGRDITNNIITRGWADPQNRDSIREGKALVPGEFVEMTFDLQPDDQIIRKGQQIGLMIFASDRDFTLWPKAGTELTVDLDGTELHLPVVGGEAAFGKAAK